MVNVFAVVSPPQSTLAASTNDIVYGGITASNAEAVKTKLINILKNGSDGRNNDIKTIFDHYKISEADIRGSSKGTVNSSDRTLYSLGRNTHSTLDQPVRIGGRTLYQRPLYTWGNNKSYTVLQGQRSGVGGTPDDKFFAVMYDCGNIVIKLRPKPDLQIVKTAPGRAANATVARGENIYYRVYFSNTGPGAAHLVTLTDAIPANTTYVSHGTGAAPKHGYVSTAKPPFLGQPASKHVYWEYPKMNGQTENWYVDLTVKVNATAANGSKVCNRAYIRSVEYPPKPAPLGEALCFSVKVPTTSTPTPRPTPTPTPDRPDRPNPSTPPPTPQPGQPNITRSKLAANLTQGLNDAQTQPAKADDVITYTLLTNNTGQGAYDDYKVEEPINDIKEYADVIEISDGGKEKDGKITWEPTDIGAGKTLTRTFKIKVKHTIPSTPPSSSDPESYDLVMDNFYGNEVRINITSPTVARTVAKVTTTTLPNTGPGLSTTLAILATVVVGYFFARSRLMAKEMELVKEEYAGV